MTDSACAYELADFHPENGHLHTCNRLGPCGCAGQLYCIASDALTGGSEPNATEATGSNAPSRMSSNRRLDGE